MRVLFVIPTLTGGGAERFVSILSNYLAEHGNIVKIIMLEDMEPFYELNDGIQVSSVGVRIARNSRIRSIINIAWNICFTVPKVVKRLVNEFGPDVVLSFLPQADYVVMKSLPKNRRYRLICSERNDPTRRNPIIARILKRIYQNCDYLVCQSEMVSEYYSCVAESKRVIISNPATTETIPQFVPEESDLRIVSAGRLDFQKNFSLLINSFADVYSDLPKGTTLTIYGDGREKKQLEDLARYRGVAEAVFLPGQKAELIELIKDAALFVMSSDFEGFPNALLEAMVIGLPVISTDFVSGTARQLVGEENGMLTPVGDREKLAKAIEVMMTDKTKRTAIRRKNRELLEHYTITSIADEWMKIME